MTVNIFIRVVPRVQHFALLAGLMSLCKQNYVKIGGIYFVGKFHDGEHALVIQDMLKHITKEVRVTHVSGSYLSGEACSRFFESDLAENVSDRDDEYALFLDDDCVLTEGDLFSLIERCDKHCGCIGIQDKLMPELSTLIVQPSFDLFCSMIPGYAYVAMAQDEDFRKMLGRCNGGGEFFLMDWFLRKTGLRFNIYPGGVYHAFCQDKFKIWGSWSADKWNSLYEDLRVCKELPEVEKVLLTYGCIME